MSTLSTLGHNITRFISNNSPKILTGVGVAGVLSTSVLAVRATPEALELIGDAAEQKGDVLTRGEVVKVAWKPYIPAVAVGATTIACIIAGNSISTKRNAAMLSLYTLTDTAFTEYRAKTLAEVGETKERKIRDDIARDEIERNPPQNGVLILGKGDQLCYDQLTGRYFMSDLQSLRRAQNDINQKIINESYASQNDFYRMIDDLDIVDYGDEYGWNTDTMLELDFTAVLTRDDRPAIAMNYRMAPIRGYYASYHA